MNRVMLLVMVLAASMEGVNISVNPTTMVLEAAAASGISNRFSRGMKGRPNVSNTVMFNASTRARVPMHMTTGSTPNHMPAAFFRLLSRNCPAPLYSATRLQAKSRP